MKKVIAFKNPSNVCYANAVLQLLWNTDFMKELDNYKDAVDRCLTPPIDLKPKQVVGMQLLKCLLLVRERFNESKDDEANMCEFNLIKFRELVQKEFWNNRAGQQDAHEFLNNLIDHIQIALECFGNKIVQNEFGAKLLSYISGEECRHDSYTRIDYDYYELFVKPEKDGDRLQDLINSTFTDMTILSGESAWECEKCGVKRSAIKTPARIYSCPKNLMICIQRFKFDQFGTKIRTVVNIDEEITIDLLDDGDTKIKYQLCGLVTHLGMTVICGHYIAIIKETDDTWLVCNDSYISRYESFEKAKTMARGDIYLLMYRII